jgi:hypothetical protein
VKIKMSNELLEKAITTTDLGTSAADSARGGLLKPEQSNRFIDYMFDATVVTKFARTIRMRSDIQEIDKIGVGERILKVATEATDTAANQSVVFAKISLATKKLRLDWELSSESLEDGIEGADLEDHIARMMATQVGNDVEDLVLNGVGTGSDPLLKALKGVVNIAKDEGHVVDAGGSTISKGVFNDALKKMPRRYKQRRNQLRFLSGSNLIQDYLYSLTTLPGTPEDIASGIVRGDVVANNGAPGGVIPYAFGIPVVEVPLLDEVQTGTHSGASGAHGDIHLTFPDNVIVGVKRDIVVHREFKPKKDTIEYTLFLRVGTAIENPDAFVVVKNVKIAAGYDNPDRAAAYISGGSYDALPANRP